jgi:hypothetical protein
MAKRSLDTLRVLTACPLASEFHEPVSHCNVCGRDVLDLSSFTREEAAALLSTSEPPCVRFVLRDGRPMFRDVLRTASVAAMLGGAVQAGIHAALEPPPALQAVIDAVQPTAPSAGLRVMGGLVAPRQDWH